MKLRKEQSQASRLLNSKPLFRERQYKRRIAQWHLDKKVKDDEMRIMLRNQKQRKREGKKSIFTIRGRRVNPKKIEQFSHRDVSWKDSQSNGEPICEFRTTLSAKLFLYFNGFAATYKMLHSESIAKTTRLKERNISI